MERDVQPGARADRRAGPRGLRRDRRIEALARRRLARLLLDGGITVWTPSQEQPAIATTMQMDGDMISYVSDTLMRDHPTPQARERLLRAHLQALDNAMPRLPNLAALGWTVAGGVTGLAQGSAIVFDLAGGGGLASISVHVASFAPLVWRRTAVRGSFWLLRRAASRLARRERETAWREVQAKGIAAIRRRSVALQ